jgi:hypothetical protein
MGRVTESKVLRLVLLGVSLSSTLVSLDGLEAWASEAPMADPTFPPAGMGDPRWEWIQKTSGEVFGGDFRGLRDGRLYFRSDETGELDLDWSSIAKFFSRKPVTVVTIDQEILVGPATMDQAATLVVQTAKGDFSVPRSMILGMNAASDDELSKWYMKIAAGLNFADATINQFAVNTRTRVNRDDGRLRLALSHDFNLGFTSETDIDPDNPGQVIKRETETSNNQWGGVQLDFVISERFYATPLAIRLGYDLLQNIQLRVTPATGAGLHVLRGGPMDLDVEVAPAFQLTYFDSVQAGAAERAAGGGGVYRVYVDWVISKSSLELELEHRGTVIYSGNEGFGQSNFRSSAVFDIDLGIVVDLDISFIWDIVLDPPDRSNGLPPQASTITMVVGLAVELGQ